MFDVKETGKLGSHEVKHIEKPREEDTALVLHTSGTTGRPKAHMQWVADFLDFETDFSQVPLSHRNLSVSVGKQ